MAAFTTNFAPVSASAQRPARGLFERIDALFTTIAKARACSEEFDVLNGLSDEQLAERGMDRADIATHLTRAYL